MTEIKANLYDCKHCNGTGTCSSGPNASSCIACAERNEIPFFRRKNQHGLICGCCGGIGKSEPMTERLNKRISPMLALSMVFLLMFLVIFSLIIKSPYFSEILTFSSTLLGIILGYYFSSGKSKT